MGVVNGQDVSADTFNNEFASINVPNVYAGTQNISNATQSTSPTTGAIKTAGGAGIAKALNVGETITAVGIVTGSNLSGTNTGDVTITNAGSTPSPKGATQTGQAITLQPANDTNPGLVSTVAQTFAGIKTFLEKAIFQDGIEVQGTQTILNTIELEVQDAYVTTNKGGTNLSAEDGGFEVERVSGGNGAVQFDSTLFSKWKVGIVGAMYEVIVAAGTQTIGGLKTFTSKLTVVDILVSGKWLTNSLTNIQSGSSVVLSNPATTNLVLSSGTLLSIAGILAPSSDCQSFILINRTGNDLEIQNGNTNASDIQTGTGSDLTLANGKTLLFAYDTYSAARWRIVGGTGAGGGGIAGVVSLTGGDDDVTVTFATPFLTTSYALDFSFTNSMDSELIWLQGMVTLKTTTGFTVKFNSPVDTNNYEFSWTATKF